MQLPSLLAFVHKFRVRFPGGVDVLDPQGEPIPCTMRACGMQGRKDALTPRGKSTSNFWCPRRSAPKRPRATKYLLNLSQAITIFGVRAGPPGCGLFWRAGKGAHLTALRHNVGAGNLPRTALELLKTILDC